MIPIEAQSFLPSWGNETKWLCLNSYNKAKRKYCETKTPQELDFLDKLENCDIIDTNLLNEIYFIIEKHPDSRVSRIFKMRYKDGDNFKCLPWKYIGKAVGLSIQGCINIHDTVVDDFKEQTIKEGNIKMNNITVSGRLTRDPECKEFGDNKMVCDFTIAVNGYKKEDTIYLKVKSWGGKSRKLRKVLQKGNVSECSWITKGKRLEEQRRGTKKGTIYTRKRR